MEISRHQHRADHEPTEPTSADGVRFADTDKALQIADKLADRWSDLLDRLAK